MPVEKISDDDLVRLVEEFGVGGAARKAGIDVRSLRRRRKKIEERTSVNISSPFSDNRTPTKRLLHPQRFEISVKDGIVVVFSDAHYWPGIISTAHRALIEFCKLHSSKIQAIVCNGDALDGATVSRHPPINWEERPSLIQEIEACQDRLGEIVLACPKAERIWNLGNHDGRFETRLATLAPQYAKIHGMHLKDHFPHWQPSWSTWINDDVVVKHRFKNGVHATHNNTIWSGKTIVTGHLHSLKVTPFTDYNRTRWGVDTGTLADPCGPQFEYAEDNPQNHRSGFAVLSFENWVLRWPELVHVVEAGRVEFRGKSYGV
jgi:hypothetical protein